MIIVSALALLYLFGVIYPMIKALFGGLLTRAKNLLRRSPIMKIDRLYRVRIIMLAVSLVIGIIVSVVMTRATGEFSPLACFGSVAGVCIPSIFHVALCPKYMRAKHYCLVSGAYLLVWGVPLLLIVDKLLFPLPHALLLAVSIVAFALIGLGAFLKA